MLKNYYSITKPGIVSGNLITAAAGFLLASKTNINFLLLLEMLIGTALIIASAGIFNNYIDRDIDAKMERTKNRALVKKLVPFQYALVLAAVLLILGTIVLWVFTNIPTVLTGLIGFFSYIFLYTVSKKYSVYSTIIGTLPGATPPVAGYLAVTNNFDLGALMLFFILVFWQLPHFYAIGIYRLKDYRKAKIPILPVTKGVYVTKIAMILSILLFTLFCALLSVFGFTGLTFRVASIILGVAWLILAFGGFKTNNETRWAKKMFKFSLIVTMAIYLLISLNSLLP